MLAYHAQQDMPVRGLRNIEFRMKPVLSTRTSFYKRYYIRNNLLTNEAIKDSSVYRALINYLIEIPIERIYR